MENDTARAMEIASLFTGVWKQFRAQPRPEEGEEATPRMAGVLGILRHEGPLTLGELAIRLRLGKATVTELVDRLQAKNWVDRMRDDRDKRRVFIWLTEEGHKHATQVPDSWSKVWETAVGHMNTEEVEKLACGLQALLRAARGEKQ